MELVDADAHRPNQADQDRRRCTSGQSGQPGRPDYSRETATKSLGAACEVSVGRRAVESMRQMTSNRGGPGHSNASRMHKVGKGTVTQSTAPSLEAACEASAGRQARVEAMKVHHIEGSDVGPRYDCAVDA